LLEHTGGNKAMQLSPGDARSASVVGGEQAVALSCALGESV
jgi:hypothetical protein